MRPAVAWPLPRAAGISFPGWGACLSRVTASKAGTESGGLPAPIQLLLAGFLIGLLLRHH